MNNKILIAMSLSSDNLFVMYQDRRKPTDDDIMLPNKILNDKASACSKPSKSKLGIESPNILEAM